MLPFLLPLFFLLPGLLAAFPAPFFDGDFLSAAFFDDDFFFDDFFLDDACLLVDLLATAFFAAFLVATFFLLIFLAATLFLEVVALLRFLLAVFFAGIRSSCRIEKRAGLYIAGGCMEAYFFRLFLAPTICPEGPKHEA
ncbi:MAG: hypothetical protein OEW64_09970 [Gammaproteobacteria bacterium]|nr:hypothetical protein [Gammaproteobacteria bacterium]MDH5304410.1 hypothetical protein [Gammaproteobacteria bacterium]MDH5322053.1 hypothetical protein [Gammaproteobacteria bacterium]